MIALRAAVLTSFGDLEATVSAIANRATAGARDPQARLVIARLSAKPTGARHARLVGPLPALALDVARAVASELPRGPRTGVFVATGGLRAQWDELAPAMAEQVADGTNAWARGLSRMHPLWMLRYLSNAAHAIIAAELGAVGDGATFAGPASAASALVAAQAALEANEIDHAIVVALDDVTADEVAIELAARKPGLVAGAGVAAIVVTRGEHATARQIAAAGSVAPEKIRHADPIQIAGRGEGHPVRRVELLAIDGVDPENAEPSPSAIAAVRRRLPKSDREVSFVASTGWLGAASLLVDVILAGEFMRRGWPVHRDLGDPRSVTATAAASPGQIGAVRVEVVA